MGAADAEEELELEEATGETDVGPEVSRGG